jgi:hypothetical protein
VVPRTSFFFSWFCLLLGGTQHRRLPSPSMTRPYTRSLALGILCLHQGMMSTYISTQTAMN